MFTKRHEQELSEIKTLTHDLNRRFQEIVEQLARIQEAQDQLAAERRAAAAVSTPPARATGVRAVDGERTGRKSGGKRARRRQASPDAITGGKSGKRRTKSKHGDRGNRHGSGADEE